MACFVRGCESYRSKKLNNDVVLSFHCLPLDEKVKEKWLEAMPRARARWGRHTRICSDHFTADSFVHDYKNRRLKPNAVPSLKLEIEQEEDEEKKANTTTPSLSLTEVKSLKMRIIDLELQMTKTQALAEKRLKKVSTMRKQIKRLHDRNMLLADTLEGKPVGEGVKEKLIAYNTREKLANKKENNSCAEVMYVFSKADFLSSI